MCGKNIHSHPPKSCEDAICLFFQYGAVGISLFIITAVAFPYFHLFLPTLYQSYSSGTQWDSMNHTTTANPITSLLPSSDTLTSSNPSLTRSSTPTSSWNPLFFLVSSRRRSPSSTSFMGHTTSHGGAIHPTVSGWYFWYCVLGVLIPLTLVYVNFFRTVFTCPGYVPFIPWKYPPTLQLPDGRYSFPSHTTTPGPPRVLAKEPLPSGTMTDGGGVRVEVDGARVTCASSHVMSRPTHVKEEKEGRTTTTTASNSSFSSFPYVQHSPSLLMLPTPPQPQHHDTTNNEEEKEEKEKFPTTSSRSSPYPLPSLVTKTASLSPSTMTLTMRRGGEGRSRSTSSSRSEKEGSEKGSWEGTTMTSTTRRTGITTTTTDGSLSVVVVDGEAHEREGGQAVLGPPPMTPHASSTIPRLLTPFTGHRIAPLPTEKTTVASHGTNGDPSSMLANPYVVTSTTPSGSLRYCSYCSLYKPDHAYHCHECKRCVFGMDHHCPFVNNCVGRDNTKFFLLFTFYIPVAATHVVITMLYSFFIGGEEHLAFLSSSPFSSQPSSSRRPPGGRGGGSTVGGIPMDGKMLYFIVSLVVTSICVFIFGIFSGRFWCLYLHGDTSMSEMIRLRRSPSPPWYSDEAWDRYFRSRGGVKRVLQQKLHLYRGASRKEDATREDEGQGGVGGTSEEKRAYGEEDDEEVEGRRYRAGSHRDGKLTPILRPLAGSPPPPPTVPPSPPPHYLEYLEAQRKAAHRLSVFGLDTRWWVKWLPISPVRPDSFYLDERHVTWHTKAAKGKNGKAEKPYRVGGVSMEEEASEEEDEDEKNPSKRFSFLRRLGWRGTSDHGSSGIPSGDTGLHGSSRRQRTRWRWCGRWSGNTYRTALQGEGGWNNALPSRTCCPKQWCWCCCFCEYCAYYYSEKRKRYTRQPQRT